MEFLNSLSQEDIRQLALAGLGFYIIAGLFLFGMIVAGGYSFARWLAANIRERRWRRRMKELELGIIRKELEEAQRIRARANAASGASSGTSQAEKEEPCAR